MSIPSSVHPESGRRRGSALLMVMLLSTLAMGIWAVVYRATRDDIKVERYELLRDSRDGSVGQALLVGARLLSTGFPPSSDYRCVVPAEGEVREPCLLHFVRSGDTFTWMVEATLASPAERRAYPRCPASFARQD